MGSVRAGVRRSPFAMLLSAQLGVSERMMEYRFPVSIPYLLTVTEAFGWVGRRRLSTGMGGVSEMYPVKYGDHGSGAGS